MTEKEILREVLYRVKHSLGCVTEQIKKSLKELTSDYCLECYKGNIVDDLTTMLLSLEYSHKNKIFTWDGFKDYRINKQN